MEHKVKLWNYTKKVDILTDLSENIKKICNINNHLYLLSENNNLYHGEIEKIDSNESLDVKLVDELNFVDIGSNDKYFYGVDEYGRVFKCTEDLKILQEIELIEESKICMHGIKGMKCKMRVEKMSVGGFGILFVTDSGQLWASGMNLIFYANLDNSI